MSHESLRKEIETRLKAQLSANYPDVKIRWTNTDLDKDNELILVAPVHMPGKGKPMTVGRTHVRSVGLYQFDVLTSKDTGTGPRNRVAEFIGNYFAAKQYRLDDGSFATLDEPEYKYLGLIEGRDRLCVYLTYEIDKKVSS